MPGPDLPPVPLACLLAGFLSAGGGVIYAGVRRSGEVVGLRLSTGGGEGLRRQVERVVAGLLVPRVALELVDLQLLPVRGEREGLWVVRMVVEGTGGRVLVHNTGGGGEEGCYGRRSPGPSYNVKIV